MTTKSEYDEASTEFSFIRKQFYRIIIGITVIGGVASGIGYLASQATKPLTAIIDTSVTRNSNGYITAQQQALRMLRTGVEDATTPNQTAALVRQMREIADLIPGYVQPDIATFLASKGSN